MADADANGSSEEMTIEEEERHTTLYLDDGDLVISAASKSRPNVKQLFRVHKTILIVHSPVFKDMLRVVGDGSLNEKYDGVPLAYLEDAAEDVAGLFDALYMRCVTRGVF